MTPEHDILAPIRRLPIEIKRDLQTLIVDRAGTSDDAFMRTEHFLGHVHPKEKYTLDMTGMTLAPDANIPDLPDAIEPPHTVLAGHWNSKVDLNTCHTMNRGLSHWAARLISRQTHLCRLRLLLSVNPMPSTIYSTQNTAAVST
ncbi:MAG: hypothetical protein ACI8Q6_003085 [Granulosicoccus sp.]|jgi:hypothetical protein